MKIIHISFFTPLFKLAHTVRHRQHRRTNTRKEEDIVVVNNTICTFQDDVELQQRLWGGFDHSFKDACKDETLSFFSKADGVVGIDENFQLGQAGEATAAG